MKCLFVLNDPPYGTERSYNALRLARELLKDPAALSTRNSPRAAIGAAWRSSQRGLPGPTG